MGGELALRDMTREGTAYRLASADGSWDLLLDSEVLSLRAGGSQLPKMAEPLRHLADRVLTQQAGLSFERVALAYFSSAPIEIRRMAELFTESVIDLIAGQDTGFTQALSGTWLRGHYVLHYGVTPRDERTLYTSDAWVSASDVRAPELEAVLWDLDEEGLRLLSWPITRRAMESLVVTPGSLDAVQSSFFTLFGKSALDEAKRERMDLLARKHSREAFTDDDEARLERLTENVRLLLPRITQDDWHRVNAVNAHLDEVREQTQGIRRKYGLGG